MVDESTRTRFHENPTLLQRLLLSDEDRQALRDVRDGLARIELQLFHVLKESRTMRQQIADLVAAVAPLVTAAQNIESVLAGEKASIDALNAKLAGGTPLDADDLAALTASVASIQDATKGLTDAAAAVAPPVAAAQTAAAEQPNPSANPPAQPAG